MARALAIGCGIVWAVALVVLGRRFNVPIVFTQPATMGAVFLPGLVLTAMIARRALRKDTQTAGAAIDERALWETVVLAVLALLVWPFVGLTLGAAMGLVLGAGFVVSSLVGWMGSHWARSLGLFGWVASFAPTVLSAGVTLYVYAT